MQGAYPRSHFFRTSLEKVRKGFFVSRLAFESRVSLLTPRTHKSLFGLFNLDVSHLGSNALHQTATLIGEFGHGVEAGGEGARRLWCDDNKISTLSTV